jgi:hypothetical protein
VFDVAKLQALLSISYDFREMFLRSLCFTEQVEAVSTHDIALSNDEASLYLNPARAIFGDLEIVKALRRREWDMTLFGGGATEVHDFLAAPREFSNKLRTDGYFDNVSSLKRIDCCVAFVHSRTNDSAVESVEFKDSEWVYADPHRFRHDPKCNRP